MSPTNRLDSFPDPDPDQLLGVDEPAFDGSALRTAMVVLISDTGFADGTEGLVVELLQEAEFRVDAVVEVKAKKSHIKQALETGVVGGADLVLTVGATGVGPRNKAPDATRQMLDQIIPGISQAIRSSGLACGAIDAATSRGIAGVSGSTVVVNLASSRAAVRDGMATIGPLVHHVIDQLQQWSCE